MAKNKKLKEHEEVFEEVFDFDDMDESYDDTDLTGVMNSLLDAANQQLKVAFDLTKLIIENDTSKNVTEEQVFSVFKKASKVVGECELMKNMLENVGMG